MHKEPTASSLQKKYHNIAVGSALLLRARAPLVSERCLALSKEPMASYDKCNHDHIPIGNIIHKEPMASSAKEAPQHHIRNTSHCDVGAAHGVLPWCGRAAQQCSPRCL